MFKNIEIEIIKDKEIALLIKDFKRMLNPSNILGFVYFSIIYYSLFSFIATL